MGWPVFACSAETLRHIPSLLREHGLTVSDEPRAAEREGVLLAINAARGFRRVQLLAFLRPHSEEVALYVIQARPIIDSRPFREIRAIPRKRDVHNIFQDLLEWCRGFSAKDREAVSGELMRTVGLPLEFFDHQRLRRLEKMVERGRLRTGDEWRLVEERVQELCEQRGQDAEIATLNTLLTHNDSQKAQPDDEKAARA